MQQIAVSALSHEGVLRDHNEDSLVVGPWTMCATVTETPQTLRFGSGEPLVVAVADGLGGHPAGELASAVVVELLARAEVQGSDEQSVDDLLQACNQTVYDVAALEQSRTGMGTTVAGVVVDDDRVIAFNVGDSRVYAVDQTGVTQLSVDDNPPLAPGETHTPVLTQMLGGHARAQDVDVHVVSRPRTEVGRLLVCTDGLSDVVDGDRIAEVLAELDGPRAVEALWLAALDAGGPDNITLALVEPDAGGG